MHVRRFVGIPTVVFLLALGCQPGRDESTETPRHDAAVFYDTVSVRGGSFSADEDKILITTDETVPTTCTRSRSTVVLALN